MQEIDMSVMKVNLAEEIGFKMNTWALGCIWA